MERLEEILNELKAIIDNFKKHPNWKPTENLLIAKRNLAIALIAESKCIVLTKENEQIKQEIEEEYKKVIEATMITGSNPSTMAFDIRTATSLLKTFDGKEEETETFIESINLLNELTIDDHKPLMIRFIKTRISGNAKLAITDDINTVKDIVRKLRQKFSPKLSSEAIMAQLKRTSQGGKKLTEFINTMETLTSQLTRAFISEEVATGETAQKLAETFATQTFMDNIANPETSLILRASGLKTLSELTTKAIAVDKPQKANVMYIKPSNTERNNYRQQYQSYNSDNYQTHKNHWTNRDRSYQTNNNNRTTSSNNNNRDTSRFRNSSFINNNSNRNTQFSNNFRGNNNQSNNSRNRETIQNGHFNYNQQDNRTNSSTNVHLVSGEFQPPQDAGPSVLGGQNQEEYIQ